MIFDGAAAPHPSAGALSPLHLLVFLGIALSTLVWAASLISGGQDLQFQSFVALDGLFAVCSAAFVISRIRRAKLQLFDLPIYITVLFFLQFGLAPLRNFIDPTQIDVNLSDNGQELVQALLYVVLGMIAFWAGCELTRRKGTGLSSPTPKGQRTGDKSQKGAVLLGFGALYTAGFITKVYLLKNHLYSYVGSLDKYYENLSSMQVLNYLAEFGTLALIIVTIEWYRHRKDPLWRGLFILAFSTEIIWSLISGMKGATLQILLAVALVSSFVMRKLNLQWFAILFFSLVLLYPISNAYRSVVNGGGEITSLGGAAEAGKSAFSEVGAEESTAGNVWQGGLNHAFERLDLLTSVAQVLTLGSRADLVRGQVDWWMLPVYPFIPRFLWPSKPRLEEEARFTLALRGRTEDVRAAHSSTAITYPGDLYLQFGLWGVIGGMLVLGIVTQWFTNRVTGAVEPRELFLYTSVFLFGFPLESDVFFVSTGLIKLLAVLYVVNLVVYGPRKCA